jgi:hypothetical protein
MNELLYSTWPHLVTMLLPLAMMVGDNIRRLRSAS